jgi:hypothetical protein
MSHFIQDFTLGLFHLEDGATGGTKTLTPTSHPTEHQF